jgi:hypothetical protein
MVLTAKQKYENSIAVNTTLSDVFRLKVSCPIYSLSDNILLYIKIIGNEDDLNIIGNISALLYHYGGR